VLNQISLYVRGPGKSRTISNDLLEEITFFIAFDKVESTTFNPQQGCKGAYMLLDFQYSCGSKDETRIHLAKLRFTERIRLPLPFGQPHSGVPCFL
jgi:hypothetical protein